MTISHITKEHISRVDEVFMIADRQWLANICNKAIEIALAEQEDAVFAVLQRWVGHHDSQLNQPLITAYEERRVRHTREAAQKLQYLS